MAENGYFSHTSLDGRTLAQRVSGAGYTNYYALGENIAYAYGAPDAARVYSMWKNSPGHYTNMTGSYSEAGLGIYSFNGYTYYTLDLGRSRNPAPAPTTTPTPTMTPTPTPTPTPTSTIKNLNVTMKTNSPAYSRNTYGNITVTVTDGGTGIGISRASVTLKLYYPNGGIAGTVYRTSNSNGNIAVYFRLSSTSPPGTYKIVATATRTGYQTGTGQITFTVN